MVVTRLARPSSSSTAAMRASMSASAASALSQSPKAKAARSRIASRRRRSRRGSAAAACTATATRRQTFLPPQRHQLLPQRGQELVLAHCRGDAGHRCCQCRPPGQWLQRVGDRLQGAEPGALQQIPHLLTGGNSTLDQPFPPRAQVPTSSRSALGFAFLRATPG